MKWIRTQLEQNGKTFDVRIKKLPKKKMQFSQQVCVFGLVLVTFAWIANFLLLWFGREPMSDVTMTIISVFGGFATGGYFMLSGVRDCSRNKYAKELREKETEKEAERME